jgi:prolipoprotein diacylglyceryltransferase
MLPSLNLGFFQLQMYPFFWGLAWAVGFWGVHQHIPEKFRLQNMGYFLGLFICSFVGAKYVFDLSGGHYTFTSGLGFVFYGGLIAAVAYLLLLNFLHSQWLDASLKFMIIFLPLSHGIGRVGCFFAGCCYGKLFFPIQLLEALFLFLIFFILWRNKKRENRLLLSQYLLFYGVVRLVLEIFRSDVRGLWLNLPPSVWISLALIIFSAIISSSRACGTSSCK